MSPAKSLDAATRTATHMHCSAHSLQQHCSSLWSTRTATDCNRLCNTNCNTYSLQHALQHILTSTHTATDYGWGEWMPLAISPDTATHTATHTATQHILTATHTHCNTHSLQHTLQQSVVGAHECRWQQVTRTTTAHLFGRHARTWVCECVLTRENVFVCMCVLVWGGGCVSVGVCV